MKQNTQKILTITSIALLTTLAACDWCNCCKQQEAQTTQAQTTAPKIAEPATPVEHPVTHIISHPAAPVVVHNAIPTPAPKAESVPMPAPKPEAVMPKAEPMPEPKAEPAPAVAHPPMPSAAEPKAAIVPVMPKP